MKATTSSTVLLLASLASLAMANTPFSVQQPDFAMDVGTESSGPVDVTLFVMSRCPDAIKCEATFTKVFQTENLPPVNPTLSFIGSLDPSTTPATVTCKHGALECAGNIQQLCFRRYYPEPTVWWKFVQGLNSFQPRRIGDLGYAKEVAARIGATGDVTAHASWKDVEKCAIGEEGRELLRESVRQTNEQGVSTSCTVFINGQKRCVVDGGVWRECPGGSNVEDFVRTIEEAAKSSSSRSSLGDILASSVQRLSRAARTRLFRLDRQE